MSDSVDAAELLDRFSSTPTTVWFMKRLPQSGEAAWNESKAYSSLRAAMQAVNNDAGEHAYDILIHEPGRDRQLTDDEFSAVRAAVTEDQGKRPDELNASNDD